MDAFDVRVSGVAEFQRALRDYNGRLSDRINKLALRQAANFVLKKARAAAPVKTGRLRKAIKVGNSKINTVRRNGKLGVFIYINPGKKRTDTKGAYYGKFQEAGYTATGHKKVAYRRRVAVRMRTVRGNGTTIVPPKNFIRNAFTNNQQQAVEIIVRSSEVAMRNLAQSIGFNANQ